MFNQNNYDLFSIEKISKFSTKAIDIRIFEYLADVSISSYGFFVFQQFNHLNF